MEHPKGVSYIVTDIDPVQVFGLQLRSNLQTQENVNIAEPLPDKYQNSSWVFFLEKNGDRTTPLLSRSRNDWNISITNTFFFGMFGIISQVMDRKMLKGIKKRAELVS